MFRYTSALLTALAFALVNVNAQSSIPDVSAFPAACATPCAAVIEVAYLCERQYTSATDLAACVCSDVPTPAQLTTCSTCLNSNGGASLGSTLTSLNSICTTALTSCAFQCGSITPCASQTDVACLCSSTYLAGIYNCAACNSANGNTNTTTLANYNELRDSCALQNYTVTPTGTTKLPSPTGQSAYVAPTLTNTVAGSVSVRTSSSGIIVGAGGSSTTVVSATAAATVRASSLVSSATAGATSRASSASSAAAGTGASSSAAIPAASSGAASPKNVVGGLGLGLVGLLGGLMI